MSWSWLTQSRSAINILQAHLQLYNFTVSTGSTWEGCKTKPQKASAGPMWGCRGLLSSQRLRKELPSCSHRPPHMHIQTVLQTAPNRDLKYISPACSSNWQLNYSFLNPSALGELGHSLNLQWERAGEFCWRHEEFTRICLRFSNWFLWTHKAKSHRRWQNSSHYHLL